MAELAERQHGVVALAQLQAFGISASAVHKRVAKGALHRVHRGVYAVGRPGLVRNGWRMAAVLAYGADAANSHRSSAGLWRVRPDNRQNVEISVPRGGIRARPGIEVHRMRDLTAEDITTVDGIPCTTVARMLVELGDVVDRRQVELAVEQAEVLRLFDRKAIDEAIARAGQRRGTALITSVLEEHRGQTLTESALEEQFLALVREAGLPDPEVNAHMTLPDGTPARIDFLWREQRLAVETDGHAFHRTRQSRERDARRDQLLRLAGFEPLRFTGRQVARDEEWVKRTMLALACRADDERSGRARPQAA
jgi:very-short-patch-repair endonuclease